MNTPDLSPRQIVDTMIKNDAYTKALQMEIIDCKKGRVNLTMNVKKEHTNGFKIAHGGITYALADSALAFSSNSHGQHAVSIETSIKHIQPVSINDQLTTQVVEISYAKKIGVYEITIINQHKEKVAFFTGTVYIKSTFWE